MRKLFLDDTRQPPDPSWEVVRTYSGFCDYIDRNGVPDVISFDHDLADEHYATVSWQCEPLVDVIDYTTFKEKTGYECAKWLIARGTLPKQYFVHSLNPVGAQNIRFIMEAAYKRYAEKLAQAEGAD